MCRLIDQLWSGFFARLPCPPAALIASVVMWAGCSFDYAPTTLAEELFEQVPNTVLRDVEHTVVRGDQVVAVLRIERVESYHEQDLMLLSGIHFTEFNSAGYVVTEVWADRAEYDSKTGDTRAEGGLVVSSRREDARITATVLNWYDSEHMLSSDQGVKVVIERGDGSTVTGVGFEADIVRRVFRFLGPVSGDLVPER